MNAMEESEQSYSLVPVAIDLNNSTCTFIQVNDAEEKNEDENAEVPKDQVVSFNNGNQWFKIELDNAENKTKEASFVQMEYENPETSETESPADNNVAHVIVLDDGSLAYLQNVEETAEENHKHFLAVEIDKKVTKKKDKTFPCTEPGCNRSYTSLHHMKVHLRNHTGDRPYKCSIEGCDKAFATDYSRKAHERTHTGEKPYPCPFSGCLKSFKTSGDLQKHIRTHTGERPFTCPINGCGKTFTTSNIRKIHLRTHTGEKPYLCTYEGCDRRFASSTNYKNHLRIHSGEKPYFCRVENCGRKFTEYSSLYKHHLVHSQAKNYRCFFCGKTYRQLSTLNTHKRTIHGVISAEDGTEIILEQMRVGKDGSKSFKNITSNLLSLKKEQTAISTLDGNVYIISEDDEGLSDFKIEDGPSDETEVSYDAIILRSST